MASHLIDYATATFKLIARVKMQKKKMTTPIEFMEGFDTLANAFYIGYTSF